MSVHVGIYRWGGEGRIKLMLNRLEQGAMRRGWAVLNMFTE